MQELLGQKKSMHVAAFRFLVEELVRRLHSIAEEEGAEARLAAEGERTVFTDTPYTVGMLLGRIESLVREVLARHEGLPAESYTDDGAFRRLVQEMMDTRAAAESFLRLYLEDRSRGIHIRMMLSLREAHRQLVAFRTRALAGLEGEARRGAAERVCVLRGYVAERIGETNEAGEDPLVQAAADGAAGADGVKLLLAAGAATGGEALVAAALYGQREAAAALLDAGIDADSRAEKVRGSWAGEWGR